MLHELRERDRSPSARPTSRLRFASIFAIALLGAGAGALSAAPFARACSCVTPRWSLQLRSVQNPDGAPDHAPFWPERASLTAWGSGAAIDAGSADAAQISDVTARSVP